MSLSFLLLILFNIILYIFSNFYFSLMLLRFCPQACSPSGPLGLCSLCPTHERQRPMACKLSSCFWPLGLFSCPTQDLPHRSTSGTPSPLSTIRIHYLDCLSCHLMHNCFHTSACVLCPVVNVHLFFVFFFKLAFVHVVYITCLWLWACSVLLQVALTCSMLPTVRPKRTSLILTACAPPLSPLVLTLVLVSF